MQAAGLQPTEHGRAAARDRSQAVQRAVDEGAIAEAREDAVGDPRQRIAEHALAGLAAAAWLFGGPAERAEQLRTRFAGVHRWLSGKYFIDELYERCLGKPLAWISDRVFLRFGDRALLDGTLHSLAAIARGSAAVFGRLQTGSLHLYAWFVLVGIVGALLWSWRHV